MSSDASHGWAKPCLRSHWWFRWVRVVLILLAPLGALAQEKTYDEALETLLEDLFNPQDDDTDYEAQYELLAQWYAQPINLNEATADDLRQFYVLSERQISNLLRQRELYGDFLTVNELLYIPGWDQATILRILPFVTVAPRPIQPPSWRERLADADYLFIARHETTLERKSGYLRADNPGRGQRFGLLPRITAQRLRPLADAPSQRFQRGNHR